MKTTTEKPLTEHEKLVLQIAGNHTRDGVIDWKEAFAKHPDWAKQLSYPNGDVGQRGFNVAGQLRRRGLLPASKFIGRIGKNAMATKSAKAHKATQNATDTNLENIVKQINREYRLGKRVKWHEAVADHPEWAPLLSYGKKGNNYMRGQREMEKLLKRIGAAATDDVKPVGEWTAPDLEEEIQRRVRETVASVVAEMGYCSRCGNHLAPAFHAILFAKKNGAKHG